MNRRALTILETLLSLGLLGTLAATSFGWIAASQRTLATTAAAAVWARAATASLAQLHDDLESWDRSLDRTIRIGRGAGHAGASDAGTLVSLDFSSRGPGTGSCRIGYRFSAESGVLSRVMNGEERTLVGEIERIEFRLHAPPVGTEETAASLTVRIVPTTGQGVERWLRLRAREIAP